MALPTSMHMSQYKLSISAVCRIIEASSASSNTILLKMSQLETRVRHDSRLIHLAVPTLLKLLARPLADGPGGDTDDVAPALGALKILGLPVSTEVLQPAVLLQSHSRALLLNQEEDLFKWAHLMLRAAGSNHRDTDSYVMFETVAGIVRLTLHDTALLTPAAAHFILTWYLCKGHADYLRAATEPHFPAGDEITRAVVHLVTQSSLHAVTYQTPAYVTPNNRRIHDTIMEQRRHIVTVAIDRITLEDKDDLPDIRDEDLVLEAFFLGILISCRDFAFDHRLASPRTIQGIALRFDIISHRLEDRRTAGEPLDLNIITILQCFLFYLDVTLRRTSSIGAFAGFAGHMLSGLTLCHNWMQTPGRPDLPLDPFDGRLAGPAADRVRFLTEDVVASHLWLYEVFEAVISDFSRQNEQKNRIAADPCVIILVNRWYNLFLAVASADPDAPTKCHFSQCSQLSDSKPLKRCAGCSLVYYHHRVCQKAAWRPNGDNHREKCLPRIYRRSLNQDNVLYTEQDVAFVKAVVEYELDVQREAVLAMLTAPLTKNDGLSLSFEAHGARFISVVHDVTADVDQYAARAWADVFAKAESALIIRLHFGRWARAPVYCAVSSPAWMPGD